MRSVVTVVCLFLSLVVAVGVSAAPGPAWAQPLMLAQPTGDAQPTVETTPVANTGDAADDPAVWVHPTDPSRSVVVGNDKGGALEVYDLGGNRLQRLTGGFFGNVDVLPGFVTGTGQVDLVVTYRAGIRVYRIDPVTRQLTNITDHPTGSIPTPGEGICLYRSAVTGSSYAFSVAIGGQVAQFALTDTDGDGAVEGVQVRAWNMGSESEGCVADHELGDFYIAEENVGIWKYGAEPGDPVGTASRVQVDRVGADGNLIADVEGLSLVYQAGGTGYLLASSQAPFGVDNNYAVYERQGNNAFLRTFRVVDGPQVDGCAHTDGIDAKAADLGPAFPYGVFVCQDDVNSPPGSSGNQNFKLVPLERVVSLGDAPPPTNRPPTAVIDVACTDLTCSLSGANSFDPDPGGSIVSYAWDLGDGTAASGPAVEHTYGSPGTRTVTLTVTDDGGLPGSAVRSVTVPAAIAEISFVGQASSNINAVTHRVTVPTTVRAGDGLLLFFSSNTTASITPPAGWQVLSQVTTAGAVTQAWRRVATAADAGSVVSVAVSSTSKANLTLAAYRGTSTANPVAALARSTAPTRETAHITPSAPVASGGSWAVSYWSHKDSSSTQLTAPGGVVVRAGGTQSADARITALLADSNRTVPAGSYGGLTATAAVASQDATMWTVVLAPDGGTNPAPGPVAFVGQATSNANSSTHQVTVPGAVTAGDGLLLFVSSNTAAAISSPAGWTPIQTVSTSQTVTTAWRRVATAADAGTSISVTLSSQSKVSMILVAYRGTSTSNPVAAHAAQLETVSRSIHVTPTAPVDSPSVVVSYWSHKDSVTSQLDPPDGTTVRAQGTQTGSGRMTTLLVDSGSPVPAGSYGSLSAAAEANSSAASMWTIVLRGA